MQEAVFNSPTLVNMSLAFVAFYILHMTGITVGYHRLLAHRSYRCNKVLEYVLVMLGYLGFQSSPLWWATLHRAHHRYTETDLDPHAPRFGLFRAYIGWFLHRSYPEYIAPDKLSKDLVNDPLYKFLDQGGNWARAHLLNSFINLGLRALIGLIWGWEIAAASLFSALFVQQIPFLLNVICHIPRAGYRNFNTLDESVNVGWVAFLTLGEGWHNNHHAFPGSARHGLKPNEFDVTWLILRAFKKLGLVSWMNEVPVNAVYKGPQGPLAPLTKPETSVALPAMAKTSSKSPALTKSPTLGKSPALTKSPALPKAQTLASELVRSADLVPAAVPAQAIVTVVHPTRGRR